MNIVQAPNPVLSEPAKEIKKIDKEILRLIDQMKITLLDAHDPDGVGLAAPQVGKSLQLFIIKPAPKSPITVYINPKLDLLGKIKKFTKKQKAKEGARLEGCLSLKDIWGTVNRSAEISISYKDEHGNHHEKAVKGFLATIIQHEYDHLQGVLFPRRVLEQNGTLYKSSKNEKGDDEFEEISI